MGILKKPVTGWRHYGVSVPGLLTSNQNVVMPGERAQSWCRGTYHGGGKIDQSTRCRGGPEQDCTCGFYAFNAVELVHEHGYLMEGVIAEVWLWGTVHRYTLGYRAQFVYPKRLWVWGDMAEDCRAYIARQYRVPVNRFVLDFPDLAAQKAIWSVSKPEPPTEQQLYDRIAMGDDEATKIVRARLSSAICGRRKAVVRLEGEIARVKKELEQKLAQRCALKRSK